MQDIKVPDGKKIVATFTTWNNEIVEYEIEPFMIDSIIDGVKGQFTFIDNKSHFGIRGETFAKVDIWFADKNYELKTNLPEIPDSSKQGEQN